MLEFFRKYQRGFFIMITAVIIISFSFFGTYSSFVNQTGSDTVAFVAVDGSKVYRSELNNLIHLIQADSHDGLYGDQLNSNPFNDGVLANDILATGIGETLVKPFLPRMKEQLKAKFQKEKQFVPYIHPDASYISAESAWRYFAKDVSQYFTQHQLQQDPTTIEAFSTRVQLYLADRRFPMAYLKQILRLQESQNPAVKQDPNLLYKDLSLFGYHGAQDWFSKEFIELAAQYVYNASIIAERNGCVVSKDEAMHSLSQNVQANFKEHKKSPYFASITLDEYFQGELKKLAMDRSELASCWRRVLLFREYINQIKENILISALPYNQFYDTCSEYVDVDLVSLPEEVRFSSLQDLLAFEMYHDAVMKKSAKNPLQLGNEILSVQEVKKNCPNLVKKSYSVRMASVEKSTLLGKIGLRKTWNWQLQDENFQRLQEKFVDLGKEKALTTAAKEKLLDSLDTKVRAQVDSWSKDQMLKDHPEWIEQALRDAPMSETKLELRQKGGKFPFVGIENRSEFLHLLETAQLNAQNEKLSCYSQDDEHFYNIQVVDRAKEDTLLSFQDALKDGTLSTLVHETLDETYQKIRHRKSQFKNEKGEYKSLIEVQDLVAEDAFVDLFKALDQQIEIEKKLLPQFCNWKDTMQARIACRMLPFVKEIHAHPEKAKDTNSLFKVVCEKKRIHRLETDPVVHVDEAFSIKAGVWSSPYYTSKAGITFFKILEKGKAACTEKIRMKSLQEKDFLQDGVFEHVGQKLLEEMQKKQSLQLR